MGRDVFDDSPQKDQRHGTARHGTFALWTFCLSLLAWPLPLLATPEVEAQLELASDWGGGYIANVVVHNTGTSATESWSVAVDMNESVLVGVPWRAQFEVDDGLLVFTPEAYSAVIPPGGQESFGFQGQAVGQEYQPMLAEMTEPGSSNDTIILPHTFCTTGVPLLADGSDPAENGVVEAVCSTPEFETCCETRWSLRCVQKAAAYARQNGVGGSDYCGRYAWDRVSVPGTRQRFPRDFNIVTLSGSVGQARDVAGPIAANGNALIRYFNLNHARQESLALMVAGDTTVSSGTIHGDVIVGGTLDDRHSVTYEGTFSKREDVAPFPFDFGTAAAELVTMSRSLDRIARSEGILPSQIWPEVWFTGSDPELNVFQVSISALATATGFRFVVPPDSSVIVNVTGINPVIQNAGFSSTVPRQNVLWNFPDATSLYMNSVGFWGSILAPLATANLQNGSVSGSVVVAAAPMANVELYSYPFDVPSCKGGRCLDPEWSCSDGTVMDEDGRARNLGAEAGFLEIAGGDYTAESHPRVSPTHRMWYAFQPARERPKDKPLAVFFNGGPGASTSAMLFSFNTAEKTLDPQRTSSIANNPTSFTQFANLLYIDAPATGFSYPVANADGSQPDIGIDMDRDAGIFIRVVTRFLERHPALLNSRVIVVGESYGGVRANLMFEHLFHYQGLTDGVSPYQDGLLHADLVRYFSSAFGTEAPSTAQLASRFGHQVLIQPMIAGARQYYFSKDNIPMNGCLPGRDVEMQDPETGEPVIDPETGETVIERYPCFEGPPWSPATCDLYNCDVQNPLDPDTGLVVASWSFDLEDQVAAKLSDVNTLNMALGVDASTIEWMYAESRTGAYGRVPIVVQDRRGEDVPLDVVAAPSEGFVAVFGQLEEGSEDVYFVVDSDRARAHYAEYATDGTPAARHWMFPGVGEEHSYYFAGHLLDGVATFITTAKADSVVRTTGIPGALHGQLSEATPFGELVAEIGYSSLSSHISTIPRPGWLSLEYESGRVETVTMPHTYQSGHTVPMRAPAEFLFDVMAWYHATSTPPVIQ